MTGAKNETLFSLPDVLAFFISKKVVVEPTTVEIWGEPGHVSFASSSRCQASRSVCNRLASMTGMLNSAFLEEASGVRDELESTPNEEPTGVVHKARP